MRQLIKAGLQRRKQWLLLVLTLFATLSLTIANYMEVLALGLMTQRGADFFHVLAPLEEGQLRSASSVTKEDYQTRWQKLDPTEKGVVSNQDVRLFMQQHRGGDAIQRFLLDLDSRLNLQNNLLNFCLVLVAVALFKAIALFYQRYCTRLFSLHISHELRQNYFEHLQRMPMEFYQTYDMGSLSTRITSDTHLIADGMTAMLNNYFQTPFIVVATLALCFLTSWQLTVWIFFGLPAILIPILLISRQVKKLSKRIQSNQERASSVLLDFLAGIQTVKVFAMEAFSLEKFREHQQQRMHLEKKAARYDLASRPIVHTMATVCMVATMLYGLYGLDMSVTQVLLFAGFLYQFYEPIKRFTEENHHIQRGVAAAERLYEVLGLKSQIQDAPQAHTCAQFNDSIVFENVYFAYPNQKKREHEPWILRDLSFRVTKGMTLAIVGPTGSGKSTLVQLLPRLYEAQQGRILLDGRPLNSYTQKSLREQIAFVPQKPFLFMDTIASNLAFGRAFTQEEIVRAAKRAFAAEFIEALPEKYQTLVAERGANFSGGQLQRLAIARALVKNAPILIMDEATSSLDSVSELAIKQALHALRGSITQIIIAHRLSTIEDADQILYLDRGEKIAQGTLSEMLANCDGFRAMWEALHRKSDEKAEESLV